MQVFNFIFYLIIFSLFFYYLCARKVIDLSFKQVVCVLILKTILGCLYGFIFFKFYNGFGNDTWSYNELAIFEYNILIKTPSTFFKNLFINVYNSDQRVTFFDSSNNFWKDLQSTILVKLLAICNLFTKGNYYTNTLFFNFFTFWGHYLLYKCLILNFKNRKAFAFSISFLFPPLLFWESGISKDGLVFIGLAGFIYYFSVYIKHKKLKNLVSMLLFFLMLLFIRNFIALSLLPVSIAFYCCSKSKLHPLIANIVTIIVFLTAFFLSSVFLKQLNLPAKMAERQAAFSTLQGGSYMYTPTLNDGFTSYVHVLPFAINHTFIRPYITEAKSPLLLFASLETLFILLIIALTLAQIKKLKAIASHPFLMLLLSLALINYLMIGYTVPFAGAIVRYRVFFEVCLLVPMLVALDTNNYLENNINKALKLY